MRREKIKSLLLMVLLAAAAEGCQFLYPDFSVSEDAGDDLSEPDVTDFADTHADPDVTDAFEMLPGLAWVSIPRGGDFDMGCSSGDGSCDPNENPSHPVTVSAFEMTETEITQAQYLAVTGESPSYHAGCSDCPVEQVDWNHARAFCVEIGGRLPSEAEWEYAARGGTVTPWTCGDATSSCLGDIAWYHDNAGGASQPVKGKGVNGFGLYGMQGNVWEWAEDCWHADFTGAPSTGIAWTESADCNYHVLRGGSWDDGGVGLRVSVRAGSVPAYTNIFDGFRCAR